MSVFRPCYWVWNHSPAVGFPLNSPIPKVWKASLALASPKPRTLTLPPLIALPCNIRKQKYSTKNNYLCQSIGCTVALHRTLPQFFGHSLPRVHHEICIINSWKEITECSTLAYVFVTSKLSSCSRSCSAFLKFSVDLYLQMCAYFSVSSFTKPSLTVYLFPVFLMTGTWLNDLDEWWFRRLIKEII